VALLHGLGVPLFGPGLLHVPPSRQDIARSGRCSRWPLLGMAVVRADRRSRWPMFALTAVRVARARDRRLPGIVLLIVFMTSFFSWEGAADLDDVVDCFVVAPSRSSRRELSP